MNVDECGMSRCPSSPRKNAMPMRAAWPKHGTFQPPTPRCRIARAYLHRCLHSSSRDLLRKQVSFALAFRYADAPNSTGHPEPTPAETRAMKRHIVSWPSVLGKRMYPTSRTPSHDSLCRGQCSEAALPSSFACPDASQRRGCRRCACHHGS